MGRPALVVFLLSAACASSRAGDPCNATGYLCADRATALECRMGTWTALPCKGSGGCQRESDVVRCDMSGNAENDLCASSAEGKGLCTKDGLATLECRGGTLKKTNTCSSCAVSGDNIVCTP